MARQAFENPLRLLQGRAMTWTVAALCRFVAPAGLPALQATARRACEAAGACGTLLLAPEGVNGAIAVPGRRSGPLIAALDRLFGIGRGEVKVSAAAEKPFARLKVRLRREIITRSRLKRSRFSCTPISTTLTDTTHTGEPMTSFIGAPASKAGMLDRPGR